MLNDELMVGIVLTLIFGSVIFYLYNRLSMTERKIGLFEGVLTDLKIMMDSAPFAYGPPPPTMREFDNQGMSAEYLNAISGPVPLQKDEIEEVSAEEDYQQTLEQALEQAAASESSGSSDSSGMTPYRTLQIDESGMPLTANSAAITVTKLSPDLDSMTVKELQGLGKQRGLSIPAGTRRKEIIDLLKKQPPALDGPAPSVTGASLDDAPLEVTL